ncbi:MAG: S-layer homology domain-containing protein [Firmicutes bacterium]|nr:S-layer homology domain-containing protein [Bacillota bacterium]
MIGMLPTMALAEEWGKVPSGSGTDTFEYADMTLDVLIVKHVRQNGTEAPPAETFEFEVEDTARGEKHPLSYYGIGVEDLKLSTNGVNDVEKTLRFRVPTKKDYTAYHWDAVTRSGTDTVAWYSKTFLLKEKNDGKPGWNYSTAEYALTFWYDIENNSMDLKLHQPGNDAYYRKAEFTNTYSSTSYELPFTKTVKQGGNTAPGKEKFALEIFDVGVSSMEAHAKDLYTATVTTKGAGTYDGKLLISGPADQVEALLCEGFYVREKDRGADHWTYDDAVWHIKPQRGQTGDQIVVNVPPASTNTPPEAAAMKYQLAIYPTTKMKNANGIYYEDSETAVEKMTFTNTYTYNTSSGATIIVKKTDPAGTPLSGAVFALNNSRGDAVYEATSNSSGVARFTDVSNGTYTLLEKSSPKGYVASDETYTLTVSDSRITMNGKDYAPVTFVNRKAAELNRTDHLAFLSGYANGTFEPDRNMTRAEVAAVTCRLLERNADQNYIHSHRSELRAFTDVSESHWAYWYTMEAANGHDYTKSGSSETWSRTYR